MQERKKEVLNEAVAVGIEMLKMLNGWNFGLLVLLEEGKEELRVTLRFSDLENWTDGFKYCCF